jgi:uncharacterized DUF497 family protein
MKTTFDPQKDAANINKHSVSLALAADLEWDWMITTEDTRHAYGEVRMIGFAPLGERLYCVVFTDRGDERRIISLRKANSREVKHYAKTFNDA